MKDGHQRPVPTNGQTDGQLIREMWGDLKVIETKLDSHLLFHANTIAAVKWAIATVLVMVGLYIAAARAGML